MDPGNSVSRRGHGLKTSHFKAEIGERGTLQPLLLFCRRDGAPQKLARYGEAFAKYKVGGRGAKVRLERCPEREEDAG